MFVVIRQRSLLRSCPALRKSMCRSVSEDRPIRNATVELKTWHWIRGDLFGRMYGSSIVRKGPDQ